MAFCPSRFIMKICNGRDIVTPGFTGSTRTQAMMDLGVSSKLNAEWEFLTYLRDVGREAAGQWIEKHHDDIGNRTTFDLSFLLEESLQPAHLPGGTVPKTDDEP